MRWLLKDCERNHQLCGRKSAFPKAEAPLRLLAVGKTGDSHVFIHETARRGPSRYAALSHPWGEGQDAEYVHNVKTKEVNLQERMRDGIRLSLLPRTMRDAIYLTRELSLQYVFVDALCIVQDDKVERDREVHRMGPVYAGCALLLYAARAKHGDSGMLGPGDLHASYGEVFRLAYRNNRNGVEEHGSVFVCNGSILNDSEPLDDRGWGYQEDRFAPRKLIFGSKQTRWECGGYPPEDGRASDGGSTLGESPFTVSDTARYEGGCWKINPNEPNFEERMHQAWMAAVNEISKRKFSHPGQRLPALHATALTFEAKMGFQMSADYWDGIWGPDAVRQLQWCVSKPEKKEERSGPSWQWASWEGAVVDGVMLDWGDKVPDSIELDANKTLSVKGASMASVCVSKGWEDGEGAWITPIEGKAPLRIYWDYRPQLADEVWLLVLNDNNSLVLGLVLVVADDRVDTFARCGIFSINFARFQEDKSTFPTACRDLWIV